MTPLAVTDTHALVWWARGDRRRLGVRARRVFERVEQGRAALFVPTLVLVELAELVRRGILDVRGGLAGWVSGPFGTGRYSPADLTVDIVLRAESLSAIPERTDRLIAATAAHLGHPLLTRDSRIGEAGVDVIW